MANNQIVVKLEKCLGTISKLFRDELKLPPKIGDGLVIIIRGLPGTGKTTMALQLAHYLPQLISQSPSKHHKLVQKGIGGFPSTATDEELLSKYKVALAAYSEAISLVVADLADIAYETKIIAIESAAKSSEITANLIQKIEIVTNTVAVNNIENMAIVEGFATKAKILNSDVEGICNSFETDVTKHATKETKDKAIKFAGEIKTATARFADKEVTTLANEMDAAATTAKDLANKLTKLDGDIKVAIKAAEDSKVAVGEAEKLTEEIDEAIKAAGIAKDINTVKEAIELTQKVAVKTDEFANVTVAAAEVDDMIPIVKSIYLSLDQNIEALKSKLESMLKSQIRHNEEMGVEDGDVKANEQFVKFEPSQRELAFGDIPLLSENLEKGFSVVSRLLSDKNELFKSVSDESNIIGKGSVLVVDGLSSIPKSQRLILGVDRIFDCMRQLAKINIIVYEPDDHSEENHLDYMADMVIQLRETQLKDSSAYLINEMHISKARYQNPARGWHQYKIRDWGLEFYPSLHFQVHQENYMPNAYANSLAPLQDIQVPEENQTTQPSGQGQDTEILKKTQRSELGERSIIEGIVGEISEGSNVALLGSRGCFKTKLCLDFLFAGARQETKEHGLLVSLIDNFDNLSEKMPCLRRCDKKGPCGKEEKDKCKKYIHLFHQRPGCITPAEFLYYINERLDYAVATEPIKRLVFWDFTQIDYRFPIFLDNKMFIPALMDTFKFRTSYLKLEKQEEPTGSKQDGMNSPVTRKFKSVLMGAGNARYTKAVSAIADNVIFCWKDQLEQKAIDHIKAYLSNDAKTKEKVAECPKQIIEAIKNQNKTPGSILSWLLLYVDRREKPIVTDCKNLYCFPVLNGQLKLPGYKWKPGDFAIPDPSIFIDANDSIKKIHQQQGFE